MQYVVQEHPNRRYGKVKAGTNVDFEMCRRNLESQSAQSARIHGWLNFSVFAVHSESETRNAGIWRNMNGNGAEARKSWKRMEALFKINLYKWSVLMRALQCNSCTLLGCIRPYLSLGLNNFIQNSFYFVSRPNCKIIVVVSMIMLGFIWGKRKQARISSVVNDVSKHLGLQSVSGHPGAKAEHVYNIIQQDLHFMDYSFTFSYLVLARLLADVRMKPLNHCIQLQSNCIRQSDLIEIHESPSKIMWILSDALWFIYIHMIWQHLDVWNF